MNNNADCGVMSSTPPPGTSYYNYTTKTLNTPLHHINTFYRQKFCRFICMSFQSFIFKTNSRVISLQENNIAEEKRVTADKDSGGSIEIMTVEKNKNYTSAENVNENIIIPLGFAIYYSVQQDPQLISSVCTKNNIRIYTIS